MQKIGSLRSINPYNPFLGHVGRRSPARRKGYEGQLHPEEALTREQAIRFYTINNAHLLFLEDQDRLARSRASSPTSSSSTATS